MGNFALDLSAMTARAGANLERTARGAVIEVGRRLVARSPVGDPSQWKHPEAAPPGYVGGRFRGNWQYSFGFQNLSNRALSTIDASGAVSVARIVDGVTSSPAAGTHYIANNLPYAQELENGHSGQAPEGMVELTAIEFQQIVNEVAAAK